MKILTPIVLAILITLLLPCTAEAVIDTLSISSTYVPSPAKVVVAVPDGKAPQQGWPSLYLLHGWKGAYGDWAKHTDIDALANRYGVMIVCPNGYNLWYWDNDEAVTPRAKMESHITREVIAAVDSLYNTNADRSARAIAGLSMGGHGAMWIGGRHLDLFGAIGSMSGALDVADPSINNGADIPRLLGKYKNNPSRYRNHSARTVIPKLVETPVPIIIECGTEDFLYKPNEAFHQTLAEVGVPHTYITRRGTHNWEFWVEALPRFLDFFTQNLWSKVQ